MAFKHVLKAKIEANGGNTQENVSRIASLARIVQPDFTLAYLTKLMLGFPARPEDYQALAAALGISPTDLVEGTESRERENRNKAREFVSARLKKPELADAFVKHVEASAKFRDQNLVHTDLYVLFNDYDEDLT